MKKIFTKALSVFLAVLISLTAAPAMVAMAAEDAATPAFPVISLEVVSETSDEVIVAVMLKENSLKCIDLTVASSENLVLKAIDVNLLFNISSANIDNGMISIATLKAFAAENEIARYTFEKIAATGVTSDDFGVTITSCGIEFEGQDVDVTDSTVFESAVPEVHEHKAGGDWVVTNPSSCFEKGTQVRYCEICKEIAETDEVELTDHINTKTEHKDATCTEAGYDKVICDDCGETVSETEIPVTEHKNTKTEHKDATCTEAGYDKVICDDCGKTVSETEIPAGVHKNTKTDHKDATCTESGYDKVICDDCGETVSETEIPATGHSEETTLDRKLPTCTEEGYIKHICKECNEVVSESIIPANGHNHIVDTKLATCTEDGYVREICTTCGDIKSSFPLNHTGHEWLEWEVITQPTYAKEGVERRVCNNCGLDEERSVPKLVAKPTELVLDMQEIGINFRGTARLFANVYPEEAAYSTEIIWESSDESVVTVDETGAIYAVGLGSATITAKTADGSLSATCEVTVSYSIIQWIIIYILFGWIWYL